MKRRALWAAVVVCATIAFVALRRPASPAGATPATRKPAAQTDEQRLEAVERVVNERNVHLGEEARRFEADGWKMVAADPPDARVGSFDPSLIAAGRERELRTQLASTTAAPRNAHNIAQILLTAELPETREAATEALGRIKSPVAREELINVLTSGKLAPDDPGRRNLAAHLRPTDLDDENAAHIAGLLESDKLTEGEKQQIAFNIALVGLRDGMTLSDNVLATLSPASRALIDRMTQLGGTAVLAHQHREDSH